MKLTRRSFAGQVLAGAGAALSGGCLSLAKRRGAARPKPAGERLNIGVIGVGGRGQANWGAAHEAGETIVALCDVDEAALMAGCEKVGARNKEVRLYKDFRVMLDAEEGLDAVFVSTPDHGHGIQAAWAMEKGCHVYVETPLARTLRELRYLEAKAKERGVILRLGHQGSAGAELRRAVAAVAAGVIGKVDEVHVWTSRPVWPQGVKRPEGSDPVPATLDWDLWLGVAQARPFKSKVYHAFNWRGWYDFGTGALGDIGCHALNLPFRALGLTEPVAAETLDCTERHAETYPKATKMRLDFPARGKELPAVALYWYDGNWKPEPELMPAAVATLGQVPNAGCLLLGDQGLLLTADDFGGNNYLALLGEKKLTAVERHAACADLAAASPQARGHQQAFLDEVRAGHAPAAEMRQAVALTESVLVGCVSQRVRGRLAWNSRKCQFTKHGYANGFIEPDLRDGWGYMDASR